MAVGKTIIKQDEIQVQKLKVDNITTDVQVNNTLSLNGEKSLSIDSLSSGSVKIENHTGGTVNITNQDGGSVAINTMYGGANTTIGSLQNATLKCNSIDAPTSTTGEVIIGKINSNSKVWVSDQKTLTGGDVRIACGAHGKITGGHIQVGAIGGNINGGEVTVGKMSSGDIVQEGVYGGTLTVSSVSGGGININSMTGGSVNVDQLNKGYININNVPIKTIPWDCVYSNTSDTDSDHSKRQYEPVSTSYLSNGYWYLIRCEVQASSTGSVRSYLYYHNPVVTSGPFGTISLNTPHSTTSGNKSWHLFSRRTSDNVYFQMYFIDNHDTPSCSSDGTNYTLKAFHNNKHDDDTCFMWFQMYKLPLYFNFTTDDLDGNK